MATWFDESRLDDESALESDAALRHLAESGARVRRAAGDAAEATAAAVARAEELARPRAVIAAGPDSRLLRAVLEPWCPVPFVAWPGPALPGWAGSLDLVVVLAPDGADTGTASAVAEAVRRGCQVVVVAPVGSLVAEHAAGRWSSILPTETRDQLATAVVVLEYLDRVSLGPRADAEQVATALDEVAIACSPHRDLAVNPAKMLAIALADTNPLVWGGSVLAARAARRVAEAIRRASGRTALAGDADHLLPVLEAARPRDVFDDPFADGPAELRPMLLVLDDGAEEPVVREHRGRLQAAAASRGVRVETLTTEAPTEVARYASLMLSGRYAAEYLRLGLVED
ncbi:SIS domain-containing protein [Nocardioides sp.]|uniref:SIS domain-containing protein n=1 Tax=Nocardioides sp. TaxID=35761 RepID=UPI0025F1B147|nr:SIS domain-containing protein [Nocardioides sp.]